MIGFGDLKNEEQIILEAIAAARKIQVFLWGEANGSWGLEEWKRMFRKRVVKIDEISVDNPHFAVELRKRLLQNAALSIALIRVIDRFGESFKDNVTDIPSNLPQYSENLE